MRPSLPLSLCACAAIPRFGRRPRLPCTAREPNDRQDRNVHQMDSKGGKALIGKFAGNRLK
jgi:hypothetical protein